MQTLHLDLKPVDENYVELRYFVENPNQYEKRRRSPPQASLPLTEIADLIKLAERDYYVSFFPEDYTVTGRRLYNWLDGSDRWLQPLLDKYRREGIVLAIATAEKLAHLPWEVLHDGVSFLVERVPAIVPVRWVSDSTVKKLTIDGEPENRALQVLFMATSPLDVKPVLDFEGEEARILEATKRQPLGRVFKLVYPNLRRRGIRLTIPRLSNELRRGPFNREIYCQRNTVERAINRLKQFRRIATRYEKLAANYTAMITIACILLWL